MNDRRFKGLIKKSLEDFWFVDSGGEIYETTYLTEGDKASLKSFGNYFSTKEEAIEAREKLKTWISKEVDGRDN